MPVVEVHTADVLAMVQLDVASVPAKVFAEVMSRAPFARIFIALVVESEIRVTVIAVALVQAELVLYPLTPNHQAQLELISPGPV